MNLIEDKVAFLFARNPRSKKIQRNVKLSLLSKVWVAVVIYLQVPLVLNCLGTYQNGVWLTISSLLVWIEVMDIGLGNGLRNKLSEAIANEDMEYARKLTSSTLLMLVLLIIPCVILCDMYILMCDVYDLMNINPGCVENLPAILIIAVSMVGTSTVLKITTNVYMAWQMPSVGNILQAFGFSFSLLATWVLYLSNKATLMSIAIVNTVIPMCVYLIAYIYTFYYKYKDLAPRFKDVDIHIALNVTTLGVEFFLIQIGSLLLFATSNILISRMYSPDCVTSFQVPYRYMSLMITTYSMVAIPFWSATTDAYCRGDWQWIKEADKRIHKWTMLFVVCYFGMLLISPLFYYVWIGNSVSVPFSYSVIIGLYVLAQLFSMRYSYFLNGLGALRLQIIITFIDSILFIAGSYVVTLFTGAFEGFLLVLFVTQIPGLVFNRMQFKHILNGNAKGIWAIK